MKIKNIGEILVIALSFTISGAYAQPATVISIRPFGDSITFGVGFNDDFFRLPTTIGTTTWYSAWPPALIGGGYRGWLTALTLQALGNGNNSFAFSTEGYRNDGSINIQWQSVTQFHDGYPGYTNAQLTPIALRPVSADFTLVHSGTNDIVQNLGAGTAFTNLVSLVNTLCTANKNSNGKILLAQIIPMTGQYAALNTVVTTYNQSIANITSPAVLAPACSGKVTVMNMNSVLNTTTDYFDGLHPNAGGYYKMACAWQNAIQKVRGLPVYQCSTSGMQQLRDLMK